MPRPTSRLPGFGLAIGLALLTVTVTGSGAVAQVEEAGTGAVVGQVTDVRTGAPVVGAFIEVLDEAGERLTAALTRNDGRYTLLRVPVGRLRLRVERIGLLGTTTEPFELREGGLLVRDLSIEAEAVQLEGISVDGQSRCDFRDRDGAAARVWNEARKALDIAAWTEDSGLFEFTAEIYQREYEFERQGRRRVKRAEKIADERVEGNLLGQRVFRSLEADTLARDGFARKEGPDYAYYAPDASVLLSDAFLDTHCFRAVRDGDRVGLRFEPVAGRELPEIEGTLWLDSRTALLEEMEFEYVNLESFLGVEFRNLRWPEEEPGGEVQFERLEGGGWTVREWVLHMPTVRVSQAEGRDEIDRFPYGAITTGARVTDAKAAKEVDLELGEVVGEVVDSTGARSVTYQPVTEVESGVSVLTGGTGIFRLRGLAPGDRTIEVDDVGLRTLGATPRRFLVPVQAGSRTNVGQVRLPTRDQVLAERCGEVPVGSPTDTRSRDELAYPPVRIGGVVLDPDGLGVAGAAIRVLWSAPEGIAIEGEQSGSWEVETDALGGWVLCDLMPGVVVKVEVASSFEEFAELEEGSFKGFELGLDGDPMRWFELRLEEG